MVNLTDSDIHASQLLLQNMKMHEGYWE